MASKPNQPRRSGDTQPLCHPARTKPLPAAVRPTFQPSSWIHSSLNSYRWGVARQVTEGGRDYIRNLGLTVWALHDWQRRTPTMTLPVADQLTLAVQLAQTHRLRNAHASIRCADPIEFVSKRLDGDLRGLEVWIPITTVTFMASLVTRRAGTRTSHSHCP